MRWDWEPIVAAVVVLVPAAAVVVLLPNHVSWESGRIGWSCLWFDSVVTESGCENLARAKLHVETV